MVYNMLVTLRERCNIKLLIIFPLIIYSETVGWLQSAVSHLFFFGGGERHVFPLVIARQLVAEAIQKKYNMYAWIASPTARNDGTRSVFVTLDKIRVTNNVTISCVSLFVVLK